MIQTDLFWGRITADESMGAMQFRTTPKEDLPHYFYIFSKLDSLETEIKYLAS